MKGGQGIKNYLIIQVLRNVAFCKNLEIEEEFGLRGQGNIRYYEAHKVFKKLLYLIYIIILI